MSVTVIAGILASIILGSASSSADRRDVLLSFNLSLGSSGTTGTRWRMLVAGC